jgi:hypothetical protein
MAVHVRRPERAIDRVSLLLEQAVRRVDVADAASEPQ